MEWNYIIHYEIAALMITIIVALHFFLKKTINTRATGLFSLLIISSLIANSVHLFPDQNMSYPDRMPSDAH